MKALSIILVTSFFIYVQNGRAQGSFVNLDFESANVSGYAPNSSNVPIGSALPGWSGAYGNSPVSQVWYDGASIGGTMISVVDNNVVFSSLDPIQGAYSLCLFGGPSGAATISQMGLVPIGTKSLQVDLAGSGVSLLVVSVGGQAIQMVPIASFANYTQYAGNISAFAGANALLSFSEPPPVGVPPSTLELDNIQFSPNAIPEPGTFALSALGMALLGWRRWRTSAR